MQLSPLQSRLAASVIASCLVLFLYLFLFAPQFAFAAELPGISSNNLDRHGAFYGLADTLDTSDSLDSLLDPRGPLYEPDFELFDRSIMGRVAGGLNTLQVDRPTRGNIDPGNTIQYVVEAASVSGSSAQPLDTPNEMKKRQNRSQDVDESDEHEDPPADSDIAPRQKPSKTLYISVNTCNQPGRISPDQTTMDPPQLTMFVSTTSENTSPGPDNMSSMQKLVVLDEGAAVYNMSVEGDIYFSISAPKVNEKYFSTSTPYNYEVTVSLDGYYHSYDSTAQPNMYLVDSDASSAYLTTLNLKSHPNQTLSAPPYMVFVQNTNNLAINGITKSYCGLSSWAQIRPLSNGNSQASIGLRQDRDDKLTQEFYISGLNASTSYQGIVALNTSLSLQKRQEPGSGGESPGGVIVYKAVNFTTKPNGACTFVFNLTLCTETRYAVPGNVDKFRNGQELGKFYDDYTQKMYDNFDKVLQQTPCQAPPTQRYSLARNCTSCKRAYKDWLCSVAIPRCEDFSSPNQTYLQMRNINASFPNGSFVDEDIRSTYGHLKAYTSSRNVMIDEEIQPGPYKEVLPCDYLCYELVRSCPASIGFSCPLPKSKFSFNTSYAVPNDSKALSCNYPGSAFLPSAASMTTVSWVSMAGFVMSAFLLLGL
ncbi:stretch-activated Ca2+-permeable channel component-domain-containing protein [Astrocystis sublimbata]|nr:stretch-activated Ca2+-permeable channel component-domain-containing protein [Astrocystis sublimbata]